MDDIFEMNLLIDFYGQLLTKRQLNVMELHYGNDYSFSEISERLSISRQGVYDNIKRAKISLNNFENKLELIQKFKEKNKKLENLLVSLETLEKENLSEIVKKQLDYIKEDLIKILKN